MRKFENSGTNLDTILIKNSCRDIIRIIPSTYRYLVFFNVYEGYFELFKTT